jgi:hypothetical protein
LARLEPLPPVIDQRHQGDRDLELLLYDSRNAVEARFDLRIEYLERTQRRQAFRFVCREVEGRRKKVRT